MGWIDMGGNRMFVPGGTTPYAYDSGYDNSDSNWDQWSQGMRRKQQEEERRKMERNRSRGGTSYSFYGGGGGGRGDYAEEILKNVFGNPGFTGAPQGSEFGSYSYKTRGDAPDYHREMPLGGTPGVWAIRNDEVMRGPQADRRWGPGMGSIYGVGRGRPWWTGGR